MPHDEITGTLALLKPDDFYPAWKWIDLMERHDQIDLAEAQRWKDGIFGLMELWGLEPDNAVEIRNTASWLTKSSAMDAMRRPLAFERR